MFIRHARGAQQARHFDESSFDRFCRLCPVEGFARTVGSVGNPPAERYASSVPEPPPNAAGLAHTACMPSGAFPKREFAGGGTLARKSAKAITQPVWLLERQTGMFLKAPPTSAPFGTGRLVPMRMAETTLPCDGLAVDFLFDEARQHAGALAMAHQHDTAALIVVCR